MEFLQGTQVWVCRLIGLGFRDKAQAYGRIDCLGWTPSLERGCDYEKGCNFTLMPGPACLVDPSKCEPFQKVLGQLSRDVKRWGVVP